MTVLYILSVGPLCWLLAKLGYSDQINHVLKTVYWPLLSAIHPSPMLSDLFSLYIYSCIDWLDFWLILP